MSDAKTAAAELVRKIMLLPYASRHEGAAELIAAHDAALEERVYYAAAAIAGSGNLEKAACDPKIQEAVRELASEIVRRHVALAWAVREQVIKRVVELIVHKWDNPQVFFQWVANGGLEIDLHALPLPEVANPPENQLADAILKAADEIAQEKRDEGLQLEARRDELKPLLKLKSNDGDMFVGDMEWLRKRIAELEAKLAQLK